MSLTDCVACHKIHQTHSVAAISLDNFRHYYIHSLPLYNNNNNSPKKPSAIMMNFFSNLFSGATGQAYPAPCVMGGEDIMSNKGHGTSATPVQPNLKWDCDEKVADRICNFNRHYAEYKGTGCRAEWSGVHQALLVFLLNQLSQQLLLE